ncbi:MAG: nucleotidyl transferase AbiEii/AbiGii toxin family protein, partial [Candidatus Methylomirabilales bacterium]
MHPEVLPLRARRLCGKLMRLPALRPFYLAGGTGLALHLGHRRSEDLDFFSRRAFHPSALPQALETVGTPQHLSLGEGSVEC